MHGCPAQRRIRFRSARSQLRGDVGAMRDEILSPARKSFAMRIAAASNVRFPAVGALPALNLASSRRRSYP
jgi:hypothetical protein